ncbi:hypothetical protein Tco_0466738, partial [Tanacetum coccineum]
GYSHGGGSKMDEDKEGKAVDPSHYRGMITKVLLPYAATTFNIPDPSI